MSFHAIPATAFPFLLQLAVAQISLREHPLDSYLEVARSVQHVSRMRSRAINFLSNLKSISNVFDPITDLQNALNEKKLDYHGTIYGLYLIGAYNEASQLVEEQFKTANPSLNAHLEQIKAQLSVEEAERQLKTLLNTCLVNEGNCLGSSTRIKRSGSLFAKLIVLNQFDLEFLNNPNPTDITKDHMPYDLIGGSILLDRIDNAAFLAFAERVVRYFSSHEIRLIDQNVYCSQNIQRKSLVGKIKLENHSVPFQLHIWDKNAERYEFLSYGNYKMNKIFYPFLPDWESYLKKDLSPSQYADLTVSSFLNT